MADDLAKCVLDTIVYYDVMDYPMTSFEVWKYLIDKNGDLKLQKYSLADIDKILTDERVDKLVEEYRGFFFLRGRKELVESRLEKNKLANEKFKLLQGAIFWLRMVPFVRMVAVTGSMAMKNTDKDSDMDLLVVLKHGKIFTGRTLFTAMTHLLGKRRYADKIQNRVCLNYFITTKSLEVVLKDIFSASEYSFILPIFGFHFFRKFQEKNSWIGRYKPNFQPDLAVNLKALQDNSIVRLTRRTGERVFAFTWIEENLKKWQVARIETDPRTHQEGSMIVADSEMLIFLPNPQGPKVFEKFKALSEKISQKI